MLVSCDDECLLGSLTSSCVNVLLSAMDHLRLKGCTTVEGFTTCGFSFKFWKKVAKPVSIGYSGSIANGLGLARSISVVEVVRITRLSFLLVYKTTDEKYCGTLGDSFCPTP